MITGFGPISTTCEPEEITLRFFFVFVWNGFCLTIWIMRSIYSGVVPQQPPITCTPISAISAIVEANISAFRS